MWSTSFTRRSRTGARRCPARWRWRRMRPATYVTGADLVICEGVDGGNLVETALRLFRERVDPHLPPLQVEIDKRIPVAGGLGGGSADAAAALRAANELAARPLGAAELRDLAAGI